MKTHALLALAFAACASAPRGPGSDSAVFEGFAIEPIREAARIVVAEVAHSQSVVRVTDGGSLMTEGWIGDCRTDVSCRGIMGYSGTGGPGGTPWTTIEVGFRDLGTSTAVQVQILYEDCDPDVDCQPQELASTGALERRILESIRMRLASTGDQAGS